MLWETPITPDAVHPRRAFQERSDVLLHRKMQLGLRISLSDEPQGWQGLDGVPEKAEVQDHHFPGVGGPLEESNLGSSFSHLKLISPVERLWFPVPRRKGWENSFGKSIGRLNRRTRTDAYWQDPENGVDFSETALRNYSYAAAFPGCCCHECLSPMAGGGLGIRFGVSGVRECRSGTSQKRHARSNLWLCSRRMESLPVW